MHTFVYFLLAIIGTVQLQFNVTPLVSHIVATIITTFILSWKELLFPLLTKMPVMGYQPLPHNSFQPGVVFKLVTALENYGNDFPDIVAVTLSSLVKKSYTLKPISLATLLHTP